MDDLMQQAIHFLEGNLEANGCAEANNLKEGDEISYEQFAQYRQVVYDIVITAFCSAPPGFALVPVNPSEEWVRSVIRTWQPVLKEGCKGWRKPEDELLYWHYAMLAARPQGVNNG